MQQGNESYESNKFSIFCLGQYRAITLTERIASLRAVKHKAQNSQVNTDLAEQRMQRWRSQSPFTIGPYFAQRLAMDGITEEEFRRLLGEPTDAVRDYLPATPSWLTNLVKAFSHPASSDSIPLVEKLSSLKTVGFLSAIEPLIHQACNRLNEGVQALSQTCSYLPFDPDTIGDVFCVSLSKQLLTILSRTMVIISAKPLTGFSHGTAGIAWALLELAALTGEERFWTTALAAIDYERSLFSHKVGNWPDLRVFEDPGKVTKNNHKEEEFMIAWCHGAPGIGLARLSMLQHVDNVDIRAEIDAALKTTLSEEFVGNHSLCHGVLGNLEFLLQASQTLDDNQLKGEVYRISAMILDSIEKHGWLCGVPLGVETPGLMTGLAGIGYELLRLAEPERVPSVLALEPPRYYK